MSYDRPTPTELIQRQQTNIESRLPGADAKLKNTILGAIAIAQAGVAHGLYGNLQWQAKQILPDTAEDEFLVRHADWRMKQKQKDATYTKGNITITGTDGALIPKGTTWQRADGVEFTTDEDASITGVDVVVAITAVVAGKDSNTDAASELSNAGNLPGINSTAIVDGSGLALGNDQESIEQLRARLKSHVQLVPTGGNDDDYILWSLEVAGVTRTWVYRQEMGLGTVTVRFMMDDTYVDGIPQAADVTVHQNYIDTVRPAGMKGYYSAAPIAVPLDMTIQLEPNTPTVQAAVQAQLDDLLRSEAVPSGTIILSHIDEAISLAEGETDHVVTSHAADITHNTGEIAVPGTITWQAIP